MRTRVLITLNTLLIVCSIFSWITVRAEMQSSSYKMSFDAVDVGGVRSTSSSYVEEDTAGEMATGIATSSSYSLNAGYQQMFDSFISISAVLGATSTSVSGLNGGTTTTSVAWNVLTDNPAGYVLSVRAGTSPALTSIATGASFADYAPAGADPDFDFTILSSASAFGFSVEGADTLVRFKDNGTTCNTGSLNTTDACWDGFSTTNKDIAQSAIPNQPSGTVTTVKLRARVGSAKIQDSGSYTTSITATAVTL